MNLEKEIENDFFRSDPTRTRERKTNNCAINLIEFLVSYY